MTNLFLEATDLAGASFRGAVLEDSTIRPDLGSYRDDGEDDEVDGADFSGAKIEKMRCFETLGWVDDGKIILEGTTVSKSLDWLKWGGMPQGTWRVVD